MMLENRAEETFWTDVREHAVAVAVFTCSGLRRQKDGTVVASVPLDGWVWCFIDDVVQSAIERTWRIDFCDVVAAGGTPDLQEIRHKVIGRTSWPMRNMATISGRAQARPASGTVGLEHDLQQDASGEWYDAVRREQEEREADAILEKHQAAAVRDTAVSERMEFLATLTAHAGLSVPDRERLTALLALLRDNPGLTVREVVRVSERTARWDFKHPLSQRATDRLLSKVCDLVRRA